MLVPVPAFVIPAGILFNPQVPVDGRPVKTTLPVGSIQVGCVLVPITGDDGVAGYELITTFAEGAEIHPAELATV